MKAPIRGVARICEGGFPPRALGTRSSVLAHTHLECVEAYPLQDTLVADYVCVLDTSPHTSNSSLPRIAAHATDCHLGPAHFVQARGVSGQLEVPLAMPLPMV